jgi:hypothetical protein
VSLPNTDRTAPVTLVEVGPEERRQALVGHLIEKLPVIFWIVVEQPRRLCRVEVVIFDLRGASGVDGRSEVHNGADAQRSAVVPEEVGGEPATREHRTDVTHRVYVYARHADVPWLHPRKMVDQYVHDSLQVNGPDAAPLPIQVLENKPPVAALGCGLATQQRRRSLLKTFPIQGLFDPTLPHKLQKTPLVRGPSLSSLPVSVEYIPGWGEQRFVEVLRATELSEKEREVVAFGEPRQLGRVVQPHIEEPLYSGLPQRSKEPGRRFLRKTDRVDFRTLTSVSGNRTG